MKQKKEQDERKARYYSLLTEHRVPGEIVAYLLTGKYPAKWPEFSGWGKLLDALRDAGFLMSDPTLANILFFAIEDAPGTSEIFMWLATQVPLIQNGIFSIWHLFGSREVDLLEVGIRLFQEYGPLGYSLFMPVIGETLFPIAEDKLRELIGDGPDYTHFALWILIDQDYQNYSSLVGEVFDRLPVITRNNILSIIPDDQWTIDKITELLEQLPAPKETVASKIKLGKRKRERENVLVSYFREGKRGRNFKKVIEGYRQIFQGQGISFYDAFLRGSEPDMRKIHYQYLYRMGIWFDQQKTIENTFRLNDPYLPGKVKLYLKYYPVTLDELEGYLREQPAATENLGRYFKDLSMIQESGIKAIKDRLGINIECSL